VSLPVGTPGEVLRATDYLEGHVNCRCTLIPRPKSYADLLGDPSLPDSRVPVKTGPEEFAKLDPAVQRSILGPGKYDLYQRGVPLEAFVDRHQSDVWGASRVAKPLRDVLAEMQQSGWTPGDPWPGSTPPAAPGPTNFVQQTRLPMKRPGEFTTHEEAEEWWKATFPNVQGTGFKEADLAALNGTLQGLDRMREMYPEAWARLRLVSFRDFGSSNAYAHMTSAEKGMDGQWVKARFNTHSGDHHAIEFNLQWYRKDYSKPEIRRKYTKSDLGIFRQSMAGAEMRLRRMMGETDWARFNHMTPSEMTRTSWWQRHDDSYEILREFQTYHEARTALDRGYDIVQHRTATLAERMRKDLLSGFHIVPEGVELTGEMTPEMEAQMYRGTAIHEFGHIYDITYARRIPEQFVEYNDGLLRADIFWTQFVNQPMRGGVVSEYAKQNEFERFAEAFEAVHVQPRSLWKTYTKRMAKGLELLRTLKRFPIQWSAAWDTVPWRVGQWEARAKQHEINELLGYKHFEYIGYTEAQTRTALGLAHKAAREGWTLERLDEAISAEGIV
jgi:hypothetical protein